VIVLIQITEGKVVDIIRTHKPTVEHTKSDLQATLYAEFGCTTLLHDEPTKQLVSTNTLAHLTKKDLHAIT
jgi:hypothetical protein